MPGEVPRSALVKITPLPRGGDMLRRLTEEAIMSNPLVELAKRGQSVWFDQMERKLVSSGKLKKMIDDDDLRGLTSNPTIFEKAISGSEDYDGQLRGLAAQNKTREEIYDALVLEDIANAAEVFEPVFRKTGGDDGFVSIEVLPTIAMDTQAHIG